MTWTDDYSGEMLRRQIDDATAEQLLAGRTVPAELESVATVMRALREVSANPVRPSMALHEQMAAGMFTGSPVYAYQRDQPGLLRRVASRLVTRVARMRLATKLAAAAVVVAVLSVGTAGIAGTLPTPVQDQFETVVESVTPYHFPEKTANQRDDTGDGGSVDEEPVGGSTDQGGVGETPSGTTPPAPSPTTEPGNGNSNGNGNGNNDDGNGSGNGNGGNNGNGNDRDKDKDKDKPTERPRD